jgi:uncharacterized membrane protein (GlpM family)
MLSIYFEFLIPFLLASLVVIVISIIAERYGTKTGGILGTLPSTVVIAFLFIAFNKGVVMASESVAVVPAEMGVNVIFLLLFTLYASRSTATALFISLTVWALLSLSLFLTNMNNIFVSLILFIIAFFIALFILERVRKTPSMGSVYVQYTPVKIFLRGFFAGIVIAIAVLLSNMGAVLSGIFSTFPVIFLSTMIIAVKEQGSKFAGGIAKSMIFGSPSVVSYAIVIYFLYPLYGIITGTIVAFILSFFMTILLCKISGKIH